jgi:hypothetical protein
MQQHPDQRSLVYGILIIVALLFFEVFNFSTTQFALRDLLGSLKFLGIPWATALSIAFCAVDFAGIARMFTPETGKEEPKEIWYLFGAWLLAATMNASLTWWGVSMAIANHTPASTAIVQADTILKVVPIFVAILVWVTRVLVIGSLSAAGDQILNAARPAQRVQQRYRQDPVKPQSTRREPTGTTRSQRDPMPMPVSARPSRNTGQHTRYASANPPRPRFEPTYHSMNGEIQSEDNIGEATERQNQSQSSRGSYFS